MPTASALPFTAELTWPLVPPGAQWGLQRPEECGARLRLPQSPLFLASSVFVKKFERLVALALMMMLCLLVSRQAPHRLREQLAATGQTVPYQLEPPD